MDHFRSLPDDAEVKVSDERPPGDSELGKGTVCISRCGDVGTGSWGDEEVSEDSACARGGVEGSGKRGY